MAKLQRTDRVSELTRVNNNGIQETYNYRHILGNKPCKECGIENRRDGSAYCKKCSDSYKAPKTKVKPRKNGKSKAKNSLSKGNGI